MKSSIFSVIFTLFLIGACSQNKNSHKPETLYIKTTNVTGVDEKQVKTEKITEISTDYFEVSLESMASGGYIAAKELINPQSLENFKYVFFKVVRKDGTEINFTTTTDFLNFMSAHGYDMVTQIPNQYGGDYTFKKK